MKVQDLLYRHEIPILIHSFQKVEERLGGLSAMDETARESRVIKMKLIVRAGLREGIEGREAGIEGRKG